MIESDLDGGGAFGLGVEAKRPYRLRLARYPAAAEVIESHLSGRPGLALDAGVGRGRLARVSRSPDLRWIGLDISPYRLAEAARSKSYELVRGDIQAVPLERGCFDVVCCIQVIEHFEMEEACRLAGSLGELLRPGGLLMISVPIFPPGSLAVMRAINRVRALLGLDRMGSGGDHLSHFDLRSAKRLVPADYRITDVRGVRIVSLPGKALEDRRWWFRLQGWLGRLIPSWTIEVNIAAQKPAYGS